MAAQICETCKKKGNRCYCAPIPNNGDRYDLSKEELVELLQKAYENGRQSNQGFGTYSWSNTICPKCGGYNVYTTTTTMYGPGNITTHHCSNCGHSWGV